jgi:glutathione synthase
LDILFLRNNPADEIGIRDWAQNAAYIFGQIAVNDHTIVVNHPESLSNAINKMYFQHFPEILRPKTIITRDQKEIEDFYKSNDNKMILKPLQGSGGTNVFFVDKDSAQNLAQIIEAISRDGYIIAQEYLPAAKKGDVRLFLMNGEPLCVDGKYAAIKRLNKSGEVRSNISAGGRPAKVEVDATMLDMAEVLRPKLVQDGMFLVGIDVVGDKLMEINVFSPGGLNMMCEAYETDFLTPVIKALERKLRYHNIYGGGTLQNIRLGSL